MSFLDQLLNGIKNVAIGGAIVATTGPAPTLNFVSGATAVYNAGTKSYDVTISGGGGGAPTGVDVKGADSAHFYVGSISGFAAGGGTIPVNAQTLQFGNTQTTPGISIATVASDIATTKLLISGQPAFSNTATHVPGDIELAIGHSTSGVGGGHGGVAFSEGGTRYFRVDAGTGGANTTSMWLAVGVGSPSASNWFLQYNPAAVPTAATIYASPNANSGQLAIYDAGNVIITTGLTGNQIAISAEGNSTGPSGALLSADLALAINNQVGAYVFADGRHNTCLNVNTNFTSTNVPSGAGLTFFGSAITNPSSAPSAGALLYSPNGSGQLWVYESGGNNFQITASGGGGTVHWGADLNGSNSTSAQWVATLSGQGGSTNGIPIRSGAYIQPTTGAGTHPIIGDGTTIFFGVNSSGGTAAPVIGTAATQPVFFTDAGVTFLSVDPFGNINVQPSSGNATLQFGANVAGTANNLLLVGQQSTGGTSGNVIARVYAPGGGTTEAYFQVVRNLSGTDTMRWAFGQLTTGKAAAWANGVSPSNTNYVLGASASVVQLNAPTTTLFLSIAGGTPFAQFGAAATDYLAFGATPATSGYIQLSGTASSTKILIATSNHNNSVTQSVVMVDSSDNMTFGDATTGQTFVAAGVTSVSVTVGATTIAAFTVGQINLTQQVNFNAAALATSATAGTHGAVPAQVLGYLVASFQGTAAKIPVFST